MTNLSSDVQYGGNDHKSYNMDDNRCFTVLMDRSTADDTQVQV